MADTEYTVDIRTQSGSVGPAAAQLDQLASSLQLAGAGSAQLEAQLAGARSALDGAAAASASAAEAMAAGTASYGAQEVAAERAAKSAEKLGQQVAAAAAKVADLQSKSSETGKLGAGYLSAVEKLQRLQAKQDEAISKAAALETALAGEGAALDALSASAKAAEAAHAQLGAEVEQLGAALKSSTDAAAAAEKAEESAAKAAAKAADDFSAAEKATADAAAKAAAGSGKVNELGEAFGRLGGPVGMAGQKVAGLVEGFQKLGGAAGKGVGAFAGLAVVIVAVAAAMAYAIAKTAIWAVGLADTARSAALSTEALSRTSESLSGIGKILPQVGRETGLAADQLQGLAKKLDAAGVSAKDMPDALRAAALAEAALGAGGADKLVQDLKEGKKSASALAAEMKSKFGDIVAKKLISLDGTAAKLKANLGETFGGLKIEGLLGGLSKMADLLGQNTASGRALKFLFETMFQPLIDAATAALPKIQRLLLGVAIGALKVYIALKPAIKQLEELAGTGDDGGLDWLAVGQIAAYGLAVAVGVLGAAVALAAAPFYAMYNAAKTAWDLISAIDFSAIGSAITGALGGIDLGTIGGQMIAGLVSGLLGGIPGVIAAMLSLGGAAIAALESKLKIGSPSKVFDEIGGFTAEGYEKGVEGGTKDAQGAVDSMIGIPAPGGASPRSAPAGGGSASVSFEGATFVFNGVKDGAQAAQMVRDALVDFFSGGSTPAPVPT